MAKRYPALIGKLPLHPNKSMVMSLLEAINSSIGLALGRSQQLGILLSGGLDSSILAILANRIGEVPCFVIGGDTDYPDVQAAQRLSVEFGFPLHVYIPTDADRVQAKQSIVTECDGDDGVYLALRFAGQYVTDVMGGDGIDEQMGGYWGHYEPGGFEQFWGVLEKNHLTPMFSSAQLLGLNVHWAYLDAGVVDWIGTIPFEQRVKGQVLKAYWRDWARTIGVPEWVIDRPKRGFVHAIS